jgi:tetratricopeptide (TPR) repeat protein
VRTTLFWLLLLAELASITLGFWFIFAKKDFLLGAVFLVVSYLLSIVIQRMTRYLVKINALKKAFRKGDYREAENILLEAMELAAKFKSTDPRIAELWNALGVHYLDNAEYTEAERCLQRAMTLREQLFGADHFLVGECLYYLGRVQVCKGELSDAERNLLRARESVIGHAKLGQLYLPLVLSCLSSLRLAQGKSAEAERFAVEAREMLETGPWRERSPMASALYDLAVIYLKQGKLAEAESLFAQSISLWKKASAGEASYLVGPLRGLAEVHFQRKQFDQAHELLSRAEALMKDNHGNEHPALAGIYHQQAALSAAEQDDLKAEALFRQALQMFERFYGAEHQDVAEVLSDYADFLKKRGRDREAAELSRPGSSSGASARPV